MGEEYDFSTRYEGDLVEFELYTDNPDHVPKIRWRVKSSGATGDDGRLIITPQLHDKGYLANQLQQAGKLFAEPNSTEDAEIGPEDRDSQEDDFTKEWDDWEWDDPLEENGYVSEEPKPEFVASRPFDEDSEEQQTVLVGGENRRAVELPRRLALNFSNELERLSIATTDETSVCSTPSAFPSKIGELKKNQWDANRSVMWYSKENSDQAIPYQIESGELIRRPHEILFSNYLEPAPSDSPYRQSSQV